MAKAKITLRNFFLGASLFVCGMFIGHYFVFDGLCESKFVYINPRFACGYEYTISKSQYDVFQISLEEYIKEQTGFGNISDIGIYFRDLDGGPTFGINQNKKFVPASLLKLPMAMAYYKFTEQNPPLGVLDQKIGYRLGAQYESSEFDQIFRPTVSTEPDKLYSVKEMIYYSLAESDNRATEALKDNLEELSQNDPVLNTYNELGFDVSSDPFKDDISPRGYSALFRQLYNASYLSEESSEDLLSILTKSAFNSGLVGGLPKGTVVAHKFGERFGLPGGQKQLHDCGIIYYPGNPYLLCVMTRGYDYKDLAGIISKISEMVYAEVDGRKL